MLSELKYIRDAFIRILGMFLLLVSVFLFVPVPKFGGETFALYIIHAIEQGIVPRGAELIVLNPLEPFLAQATIAAALAFFAMLPLLALELWRYVAAGLFPRERIALACGLLFTLFLTVLGAAFAYFILVPSMVRQLYVFLPNGVDPLFSLGSVVSLVAGFTLGTSLVFLLPLGMIVLSGSGVVPAPLWRAWARPAVLLVLIVSAIITPDGSGVGMILLAAPVCALYTVGYAGAKVFSRPP